MALAATSTPSRWPTVGLWVIRGLLALAFVGAGGAKLYGVPMMVQEFEHIGLGQWFRYLTGALEVLGAFLILTPSLAAFGALLLIGIMIGATIAHLFVIGGTAVPALVLLAPGAIVAYVNSGKLASLARIL